MSLDVIWAWSGIGGTCNFGMTCESLIEVEIQWLYLNLVSAFVD